MFLINLFRLSHAFSIVYRIVEFSLEKADEYFVAFIFTQKLVETIAMCFYFLTSVYVLWYLSHFDVFSSSNNITFNVQKERTWLTVEIICFLLQIFGAGTFILLNQIKGIFKKT